MLGRWLHARWRTFAALLQSRLARGILLIWAAVSTWDTLGAQLVPPDWSEKWPRVYDLISVTSGYLAWPIWLAIGAVLIFVLGERERAAKARAKVEGFQKLIRSGKDLFGRQVSCEEEFSQWQQDFEVWLNRSEKFIREHEGYRAAGNFRRNPGLRIVEPVAGQFSIEHAAKLNRLREKLDSLNDHLEFAQDEAR